MKTMISFIIRVVTNENTYVSSKIKLMSVIWFKRRITSTTKGSNIEEFGF